MTSYSRQVEIRIADTCLECGMAIQGQFVAMSEVLEDPMFFLGKLHSINTEIDEKMASPCPHMTNRGLTGAW